MSYDITIRPARPDAPPADFWSTFWDPESVLGDWRLAGPAAPGNPMGLDSSDAFTSSVILSLFTDARAPDDWRPEVTDRRGWWGDGVAPEGQEPAPLGSHLWLLAHEVVTPVTINLARVYAEEALAWITATQAAARVIVTSGAIETPRRGIWIDVQIIARDGQVRFARRFDRFWSEVR